MTNISFANLNLNLDVGVNTVRTHTYRMDLNTTRSHSFCPIWNGTSHHITSHRTYQSCTWLEIFDGSAYVWHVLYYCTADWTWTKCWKYRSCLLPLRDPFRANLFYCNIFSIVSWISISKMLGVGESIPLNGSSSHYKYWLHICASLLWFVNCFVSYSLSSLPREAWPMLFAHRIKLSLFIMKR